MCTSFQLKTLDGAIIHGRSQEFGIPYESEFVIIPRNSKLRGWFIVNRNNEYEVKYSFLGANQPGLNHERQFFTDGLNEKGVSVSLQYYYYQNYRKIPSEKVTKNMINYLMHGGWILGNISSVQELKEKMNDLDALLYWPKEHSDYGFGIHTIVMDKTGQSVVLEHQGDKLVAIDNPLKVMTNGSELRYHYENMRLFSHLTPYEVESKPLKELKQHKLLTSGNGLVGMMGDYTANSRFIRAAILSSNAEEQETAEEGVILAERILGSFDFVVGVQRETKTEDELKAYKKIFPRVRTLRNDPLTLINHTDSLVIKDLKNLKFYFRTYNNTTLKCIDLNKYKDTNKILIIKTLEDKTPRFFEVEPKVETSLKNYN